MFRLRRRSEFVETRRGPNEAFARDIDCNRLLSRQPRVIDLRHAARFLTGKRVLITGAGGTIGAELARQVAGFVPEELILVDNSEFNLYEIDLELRNLETPVKMQSRLVDVARLPHLRSVFDQVRPEIVLHAAAYKHVPIVEDNLSPAALTNISGAKNVFDLAIEYGVEAVAQISTDKAVNPTSFMGATKRVAELYAQALDIAQTGTRFVIVRFGNVLGSTGSVAPLFQRQIMKGGPVTVTHKDVTRFFMTTREAVQLVLRAASLDVGGSRVLTHDGRIFVLDMGEPVKISLLAERMIEAAGLKPYEDIDITYTGLRPGEKLFEEVFHDLESLVQTGVDGIFLASPSMLDLPLLRPRLEDIIQRAQDGEDGPLAKAVHHLVPEFRRPTAQMQQFADPYRRSTKVPPSGAAQPDVRAGGENG